MEGDGEHVAPAFDADALEARLKATALQRFDDSVRACGEWLLSRPECARVMPPGTCIHCPKQNECLNHPSITQWPDGGLTLQGTITDIITHSINLARHRSIVEILMSVHQVVFMGCDMKIKASCRLRIALGLHRLDHRLSGGGGPHRLH